jgi:hypothetical protein
VRPSDVQRLTVQQTADRYAEMIRAKAATGALAPGTAEVYTRDVHTFAELAGPDRVLDDLGGADVDEVLLKFAHKPDARRAGWWRLRRIRGGGPISAPSCGTR